MSKIFKELFKFKLSIIIIFITITGSVFCTLNLPNCLSDIIDYGVAERDLDFIFRMGCIMLGLAVLGMLLNIITGFYSAKVSMGLGRNLRNNVFKKIQKFSLQEFDSFSTSSLITRTNNDITQIQNFFMMFLKIIIMAPIMCLGGIIMTFGKNSFMSSIIFFSIPVLVLGVYMISKRAIPLSMQMQKKIDRVNLVMREKLKGIRVIRAFVTEDYETGRFRGVNADLMDNSLRMQRTIALMEPLLMFVLNMTVVVLLYIGETQVKVGSVEVGDIIAIIQYVMQIMISVTMMSVIFVMYPRAAASASRIDEIMDKEVSVQDKINAVNCTKLKGDIVFKNVSFCFSGAEHPALDNISFRTRPGETTAIIGNTGSGKSILVKLIMRYYDVTSGEILIDGTNIKDYNLHSLRKEIGYVPQKALLFKNSIEENIKMGNEYADKNMILEAAEISQSLEFINKKEKKLDSEISQGGKNVSGGQRQRLAVARAIVRKPKIYIFDDSFSAIDVKTERDLREALFEETSDSTVIIVAQRISTVMNADRIIVLDGGKAVGIGRHEELLRTCKIYQEIARSQLFSEEVGA